MSLWRKRLSIKSDDLSIKSSKGIEMSIEAMKQALEALQYPLNTSHEGFNVDMAELLAHRAIKSLEESLTKQEQDKPVAWQWLTTAHFRKKLPKDAEKGAWNPLYTTPQQRTWVGLTDEDKQKLATNHPYRSWEELCSTVEAKLKDKNI